MSDWFSSLSALATQATQFADQLTETLVATVETASSDLEKEQASIRSEKAKTTSSSSTLLPWETDDESKMILSQDLMERIFALSLNEKNFTSTPANIHAVEFNFSAFVPVIMKLKDIDANLARVHAKLSLKMNEETFWRNYHFRVYYLRALVGLDPAEPFQMRIYPEESIIFKSNVANTSTEDVPPVAAPSSSGAVDVSPSRSKSLSPIKDGSNNNSAVSSSPAPSIPNLTAAEVKQQQQAEKDRLQQQRKHAEALLAAAVEAELSEHEESLSSKTKPTSAAVSASSLIHPKAHKDNSSTMSTDLSKGSGSSSGVDVMAELAAEGLDDLDIDLDGIDDADLEFDDLDDLDLDADAGDS
jgi:hypothetical protein